MTESAAHEPIFEWLSGAMATSVVSTVVAMDLPEAIGEGCTVDELAARRGLAPGPLVRLLRALTRMRLCHEIRPGAYALTETGALLTEGHPESLRDMVRLMSAEITCNSWTHLEHSLRTGRAGFDGAYGMSIFDYLVDRPELATLYNSFMSRGSREVGSAIRDCYDFGRYTTMVDVGGGDGTLLTTVAERHPHLHGTVFDNPRGARNAADRDTPPGPYLYDLHMLVIYGGRERTLDELEKLCASAGLAITEGIPVPGHPGCLLLQAKAAG
ncbi:methyltransferase [Nocardia transvalensis]|uniref:methyltransferase n=1 Tax=Nocardia transvalensis TaxID=37333 RepID=UPI0018937209|nr:methyltransferase [Nocardia transvalensis]MBF6329875.1 hypothetical protein [Nocardia transvalensis]